MWHDCDSWVLLWLWYWFWHDCCSNITVSLNGLTITNYLHLWLSHAVTDSSKMLLCDRVCDLRVRYLAAQTKTLTWQTAYWFNLARVATAIRAAHIPRWTRQFEFWVSGTQLHACPHQLPQRGATGINCKQELSVVSFWWILCDIFENSYLVRAR